ncbi:hypothetical protein IJ596_08070, partial [bacterium]|nr:hypothetical protein [bacterium]
REGALDSKENELNKREGALLPKENELNEREQGLVPKEQELSAKEQELRAKERNLSAKEQELSAEKQDLDARKKELAELEQGIRNNTRQKETEAIREELRKSVRTELEEEFAEQFKKIAQENKKLDQRVRSIDAYEEFKLEEIASRIRTQYKINDPEVKVYENYGEQMVVTSRMLNNHSHVLRNCSDNTIVNLVDAMKDNNGHISAEILKATENILKAKKYCYVDDLPAMIKAIKDEYGRLDNDKYGFCIALLAMPGTSFYTVLDSMTKKFKLTGNPAEKLKCPEPSFVSPYKILVSYNMLKGRWESSKYWNNMTSGCNQSLNTKLEYLSIEKKKEYIDALEKTQYWARYHDCDTGNRTSEAISKVISRLQTD